MRVSFVAVSVAVGLALGGCSLFGDDDEALETAAEAPEIVRQPEPVQAVSKIEIGRTRAGFMVSAFGTAPAIGYGRPQLRPRRNGQPGQDGLIDLDFVAIPPSPDFALPQGNPRARSLRADLELTGEQLRGARGIRVHATDRGVQMMF